MSKFVVESFAYKETMSNFASAFLFTIKAIINY